MAEQILQIENVDPKDLYGPNDKYLDKVKALFPKLKIIARGDFVKVMGDEEEMEYFISRFEMLTIQLERKGKIDEKDIEDVMLARTDDELQEKMSESDVLVFGRGGLPIKAITANQKRMVTASEHKDLVFAVGPAGTGKTYTAVALAVRALKAKQVRRIILTRPAVEADEHLGFLPGDLKDKLDPYLQPLYDALRDMIPASKLEGYLDRAFGFHERSHVRPCLCDLGRGAERHKEPAEDVPHPHGSLRQVHRHGRHHPDRPAAQDSIRTASGHGGAQRREGH